MGCSNIIIRRMGNDMAYLLPTYLFVKSGFVSFESGTQYSILAPYSGLDGVSWIDTNTEKSGFLDMGDVGSTWICGCEFKISYTLDKTFNGVRIILTPGVTKTVNCNECVIPQLPIYIDNK